MKRPPPKRRTILKLLLLLIAGAAVNVAVAWACALFALCPRSYPLESDAVEWVWQPDHDWPTAQRGSVSGSQLMQHLSVFSLSDTLEDGKRSFWCQRQIASGFPYLSLAMRSRIEDGVTHPNRDDWQFSGRLVVPVTNRSDNPSSSPIEGVPLIPLWPGFAVNTLFYAGVLWLLFAGPFALRRMIRRRRGQCPHCAYPIGTSEVCTECGHSVMPAKAGIQ